MTTDADDPTIIKRMIEEFRAGGTERLRASNVLQRISFDESMDCLKRKRNDSLSDYETPSTAAMGKKEKITESTFFETPKGSSSTRKSSDARNDSLQSSPWQKEDFERQLLEAKCKITDLEGEISGLKFLQKKTELMFEKDRDNLQRKLDKESQEAQEIKNRWYALRRKEAEAREEIHQYKCQIRTDKLKFEDDLKKLSDENLKLKDELHLLDHNKTQEQLTSSRIINQLKLEAAATEHRLKVYTARNEELEKQIKEILPRLVNLEQIEMKLQSAETKIKDIESERELYKEDITYVKSQQQKLISFTAMEREVARLREQNRRLSDSIPPTLLLEEMVDDLKARQADSEKRDEELAWTQGQLIYFKGVLDEWHKLAKDFCDAPSTTTPQPMDIRRHFSDLQKQVVVLTAELGDVKSLLKEAEYKNGLLTVELQSVKKDVGKYETLTDQHTNRVRILQKKVHLFQMERDSYRSQLDFYEKELTITPMQLGSQSPHLQQMQQRMDTMEKIIDGYRKMLDKMESDTDKTKEAEENIKLLDKVNRLEAERNKLLLEKERISKQRDLLDRQLEYRVLKGDYNPGASKVLHFRMNPAAEAEEKYEDELDKLKNECNRLRQRVKLLEEGDCSDITQKIEEIMASQEGTPEVQALQEIIKSQELKMQRMRELFITSAAEYREVCCELFGYKVDRTLTNNVYSVSSVIAESPDDHLMFKRLPDGTIDMMETPYSTTLGELIDLHLHQHHSFPLFLGAITVELFNRQTITS